MRDIEMPSAVSPGSSQRRLSREEEFGEGTASGRLPDSSLAPSQLEDASLAAEFGDREKDTVSF
jgi:hypothetical protein